MTSQTADNKRYPRCILGTCCVPWTAEFELDEALFRRTIREAAAGTKHLYIFGTAGEGYAVSDAQFDRIARVFAHEMEACGAVPMVGVISGSTTQVIERISRTAARGVDEFQIALPSWGACTASETRRFFDAVCGRFPTLRFVHYNVARSGRMVEPAEYTQIATDHDNLVGVKYATDSISRVLAMRDAASALRMFFTEYAFAWGSLAGVEPGLLISLASINWQRAQVYFDAAVRGDATQLLAMADELAGIGRHLNASVAGASHMDGAYDTALLKLRVPEFPLRLLPPYETIDQARFDTFRAAVQSDFPQWLEPVPAATLM